MITYVRLRLLVLCLALVLLAAACSSSAPAEDVATAPEDVATAPEIDPTSEPEPEPEATTAEQAPAAEEPLEDQEATDDEAMADQEATAEEAMEDEEALVGEAVAEAQDGAGIDVSLFFEGALVGDPVAEECTLSGGAVTTCYRITVAGDPVTYDTGPFCPTSITDTAEAGGLWLDGTGIYEVDGAFIAGLAELYDDDNWMMFDENGNINVTETAEEFDLAARPNVDPSLQNHCVEGQLAWLENGEPVASTVVIPAEPVLADGAAASRGNLGVTLDGVVIAASAPVQDILAAYTIAAFDDCGGHYNPVDGYHLHGAVGCSELGEAVDTDSSMMFAYAMDGFPVHSYDPTAVDLDECGGHDTGSGYHYHANSPEQNLVIECLIGQTVATADAGGRGDRPPRGE